MSFFGKLQKVTERSRMVVTFQHCVIINTFNRQSTKTKQDNILCASNFHVEMFSNCIVMPWSLFTEFSSACNWKQTSQSPALECWSECIFCCPKFSFFSQVKLKMWQWIPPVLFIEKLQDDSCPQKCSITDWFSCYQCLHLVIEFNQSANEFQLFPWLLIHISS